MQIIKTIGAQSGERVYTNVKHMLNAFKSFCENNRGQVSFQFTPYGNWAMFTNFDSDEGEERRDIEGLTSLDRSECSAFSATYDAIEYNSTIYCGQRDAAIVRLTNVMNNRFNSSLRPVQVEHWIGSDADLVTIDNYVVEVRNNAEFCVTVGDVMSIWENDYDDILRNLKDRALSDMDIEDLPEFLAEYSVDVEGVFAAIECIESYTHTFSGGSPELTMNYNNGIWSAVCDSETLDVINTDKDYVITVMLAFAATNGNPCNYLQPMKQRENKTTNVHGGKAVVVPLSTFGVTHLNGDHAGTTTHLSIDEFIEGYQDILGDRGKTIVTICVNKDILFIEWYNGFMEKSYFEVIVRKSITEADIDTIESFANNYDDHEMAMIKFTRLGE
jgi:hypothetical protein